MRKNPFFQLLLFCLQILVRWLLSLRYRIEVVGLDKVHSKSCSKKGGILFLPNHPAEIDPVILESVLWQAFKPCPLVVEHFYYLKGFQWFMDLIGAMPLPTMDALANKRRAKKVKKQFDNVVDALNEKRNFLIYPSGRLKVGGAEVLGGASFIHDLLHAAPQTNVVLVRTTGLWGSRFSRAITGSSPDFGKTLKECFWILLKNGLFFTPKRDVRIEIEPAPSDFPYTASRLELNQYLQAWYNRPFKDGVEKIRLIPYFFWKRDLIAITALPPVEPVQKEDLKPIPQPIQDAVFKEIARLSQRPQAEIQRGMHLSQDLGLDSLDVAEIYVFLDHKYDVTDLFPGDLVRVEDVLQAACGWKKRERWQKKEEKFLWPQEERNFSVSILSQTSIQEAFLLQCDRMGSQTACADAISGVFSYRKLKMAALILAGKIREIPGDHVGVMFPSSVGSSLVVLATLLAKKIPVMINWTSGIKALDHVVEVSKLSTVLTSARFLDRLEQEDLGKVEDLFLFMEDLRGKISWKDKLRGVFLSYLKASTLLKILKLGDLKPSDPAVLLFTSGTETLPKGVPLSHGNILSNQIAALSCVSLTSYDILYGVLPPFHSFGFSVTGILPLLAGLRVCYAPDPTDSHGMAHDVAKYLPTLFCCAPSFIRGMFRVADPQKLGSLHLIVSGAEKTPQELFDYVKQNLPSSLLIEGYGITECSPIVSLDRPQEKHVGVGKPLPGIEILIFDPQTLQEVPPTQEGEVGIFGPSVFNGYLGVGKNPFVEIRGKRWYASGDRGSVDAEGHLILSGRLKRFVKIGGEMVSLSGLEEELLRISSEKKWSQGDPIQNIIRGEAYTAKRRYLVA